MRKKSYDVKTKDEALQLASKEFGIAVNELDATVIEEKRGFFGMGGKLQVEVKTAIDGIEKGKKYLQTILDLNGFEGYIEKKIRDNIVFFNIDAKENNGMLIGKNSKHLSAIQTLVNLIINNYYDEDDQVIVKVDIGGYRRRRETSLERQAVEYGKQVARTKQEIRIDGLNAYERKIIHDKLSTWKEITTHSEGEDTDRVLIISHK